MKVLLLAGTGEAAEFARLVASDPRRQVQVLASFAGRSVGGAPPEFPCPTRVGGFGGINGLAATLQDGHYDWIIDATHPFAAQMPHHAALAAAIAGVSRLRILRSAWSPGPGDNWHSVADLRDAAAWLAGGAGDDRDRRRVLLTIGRYELEPFAGLTDCDFVVRSIDPPTQLPGALAGATVIAARPPFDLAGERVLLARHRIDTIVTKNSGGPATAAKLAAAREVGAEVVMVERPAQPAGPQVETAEQAVRWIGV